MKKRRIRWGRVVIAASIVLALLATIIYYIILFIASLFSTADPTEAEETDFYDIKASKELLHDDKVMHDRLDSLMHQPQRLDTNMIAISVFDATTGQNVYNVRNTELHSPASCMKIATALAAIETLGIDYRYRESIQVRGTMKGDTLIGNMLVHSDDDPLLESFDSLIQQMKNRGIRHVRGNVYFSLARTDTLRPHPSAKVWDIPYWKTPLMLKGQRYVERQFMANLSSRGVSFKRDWSVRPKGQYRAVASSSHKLTDVLTPMLIHSSNIKADAVFYHLDYKARLSKNHKIDWDAEHYLRKYLVKEFADSSIVINDGSGLSPDNRMSSDFLVALLKRIYSKKHLREYFINEGLASPGIPGRSGSLLTRMSRPEYRNRLYCKTGTQVTIGTSSLAGFIHGYDDHWYIFAIINTDSPVAESRMFQDRVCKLMMKR